MKINSWHFLAISFWNNMMNEIYIESFLDLKKEVFTIYKYSINNLFGSSTDIITIGSTLNINNDPFYIKHISIDTGGTLISIDSGANG